MCELYSVHSISDFLPEYNAFRMKWDGGRCCGRAVRSVRKRKRGKAMGIVVFLSSFIVPFMLFYIVGFGVLSKRPVFDDFLAGASDGLKTVVEILPTLIGLMTAVGVLRASGFLEFVSEMLAIPAQWLHIPVPIIPVMLVRVVSGSAATGLILDLFQEYGTDSLIGLMASIMMGCTETVFYTMSVYYMSVGIRKTRWTLPGALIATAAGIAASMILAEWMVR